jgi:hypothetical protein
MSEISHFWLETYAGILEEYFNLSEYTAKESYEGTSLGDKKLLR